MADSGVRRGGTTYDTWQDAEGQHRDVVHIKALRTASRKAVAAATSSTELLADSGTRAEFTVFNDSTADLLIGFGSAVTANDFTHRLAPGSYFEYRFAGPVYGIWDAADGSARITELSG